MFIIVVSFKVNCVRCASYFKSFGAYAAVSDFLKTSRRKPSFFKIQEKGIYKTMKKIKIKAFLLTLIMSTNRADKCKNIGDNRSDCSSFSWRIN